MTVKMDRTGIIDLDTHPRFRSNFPAVKTPKTFELTSRLLGMPMPDATEPRYFSFTRLKTGTEIGLKQGVFWMNLNAHYDVPPMRFAEARRWAQDFADAHGFIFRECKLR